jgi:hypothetical protein
MFFGAQAKQFELTFLQIACLYAWTFVLARLMHFETLTDLSVMLRQHMFVGLCFCHSRFSHVAPMLYTSTWNMMLHSLSVFILKHKRCKVTAEGVHSFACSQVVAEPAHIGPRKRDCRDCCAQVYTGMFQTLSILLNTFILSQTSHATFLSSA